MRPLSRGCVTTAFAASLAFATGCRTTGGEKPAASRQSQATLTAATRSRVEVDQPGLIAALVKKHGEPSRVRAERGVRQVAAYWRAGAALVAQAVGPDAPHPAFRGAPERSRAAGGGQGERRLRGVHRRLQRLDASRAGSRRPAAVPEGRAAPDALEPARPDQGRLRR